MYLPPEYEYLVETRFRFQRYWALGRTHWKGIPIPRIFWLSAENRGQLRQAVPEADLGGVWLPPLLVQAIVRVGDR